MRTQVAGESGRRSASSRPIQQLTGQVSSQDNQYQCGQPLLQLGIIAPMPITSPRIKNQSTCRAARPGAKRAQSQAQRMETTTKSAVLAMRAVSEGTRPREQRVRCYDKNNREQVAPDNDGDGFEHRLHLHVEHEE
jgi:hypothetical protein